MSDAPRPNRRAFATALATALGGVGLAGCGTVPDEPGVPETPPGGRASTARSRTTDGPDPTTGTGTPIHPGYPTTEVRVRSPDGALLGSITAAIADTPARRYRGLSDTAHLPEDRGMLFVYESVANRTFVMRRMDFGIDIVYADGEGTITRIHHAPAPGPGEDGSAQRYPGRGQYVLEVGYGWTTDRGIEAGDVLHFDR